LDYIVLNFIRLIILIILVLVGVAFLNLLDRKILGMFNYKRDQIK